MKYSIITINYNNREGLRRTIESVVGQTCRDYEYIVIDGGSTDGSTDVIRQYADHIDYWVSEPDRGVYNAMNKGIAQAHGDYLNFMNSGDQLYDPQVLADVAPQLGLADIVVGRDFHENEQTGATFASILPPRVSMATFYVETLPHQGAFISRRLFLGDAYDESLRICADWAFYVKKVVVEGCSVRTIDTIVARREQGGLSTDGQQLMADERRRVLETLLPPGVMADYASLSHLDRSTLYKLLCIADQPRPRRWLTLAIKVINRLYRFL